MQGFNLNPSIWANRRGSLLLYMTFTKQNYPVYKEAKQLRRLIVKMGCSVLKNILMSFRIQPLGREI